MLGFILLLLILGAACYTGFLILRKKGRHFPNPAIRRAPAPVPETPAPPPPPAETPPFDIRPREDPEPVHFRFISTTSLFEILVFIKVKNNGLGEVLLDKITWDFWMGGMHIKSSSYSDPLTLGSREAKEICLRDILNESENADVSWAKQAAEKNCYLEGIAHGTRAAAKLKQPFTLLDLAFTFGKEPRQKPKGMDREVYLDSLTGMFQRKFLDENLQTIIDRDIHKSPISFIMVDIDDFKKINDGYGHITGDEVIRTICKKIRIIVGDHGLCIRYGGDEFSIILQDYDLKEAEAMAEKIRQSVEQNDFKSEDGEYFRTSVSIGVATLTEKADAKLLIKHADDVLRFSKKSGKNKVGVNQRRIITEET